MMPLSAFPKAAVALATAALTLAILAPTAGASADAVYQACRNESGLGGFSKQDLQAALGGVPADLDEYYGCSAQINSAIAAKSVSDTPKAKSSGRTAKAAKSKAEKNPAAELTRTWNRRKKRAAAGETKPKGLASSAPVEPLIAPAPGRTLASTASSSPGPPPALLVGLFGLILLLAVELLRRLSGRRREAQAAAATVDDARGKN